MLIKVLIATGVVAIASAGAALYFHKDAQLQRERAEALEKTNETLTKNLTAIAAADSAVQKRSEELKRAADVAAKALEEARKDDETLDSCLAYDPGVDVTGLRNNSESTDPSSP